MVDKVKITRSWFRQTLIVVAVSFLAGCALFSGGESVSLKLEGTQEVPPVKSKAKGKGKITVMPDRTVSGKVSVSGFTATVAHIHMASVGKNGPVIVTLFKTKENSFAVPDGATLSEAQFAAYKAGNLYVNVHSAKYPGGEVRAQIAPPPKK